MNYIGGVLGYSLIAVDPTLFVDQLSLGPIKPLPRKSTFLKLIPGLGLLFGGHDFTSYLKA
jgi:hypothetical protein